MDNATAEYTFVTAFFSYDAIGPTSESNSATLSPTAFLSPDRGTFIERRSTVGSDYGGQRVRSAGMDSANGLPVNATQKEAQATVDALWKQIMDPVLAYCEVCPFLHLLLHLNATLTLF